MKTLIVITTILLCSIAASAQQIKRSDFLRPQPVKRDIWKPYSGPLSIASTVACNAGATLDIVSSQGLHERNAFFRNSRGQLDNRKALLSFIPCGASYLAEKKYPKATMIFRFVYGGIKAGLAVRNWQVHRRMK